MAKKKKDRPRAENRYAHLNEPKASFDFHDRGVLSPTDIRRLARDFLEDARRRGWARVRIITGRGRNSARGPVVRPTVLGLLAGLQRDGIVLDYKSARMDAGGDGAVDIELETNPQ
ncbi:MAG: Smr/MutS family protein [Planctomycetota bacterium]